jgi:hypothetical protein
MINQFKKFSVVNLIFLFFVLLILRIGIYTQLPIDTNTGFIEIFSRLLIPFSYKSVISPSLNVSLAAILVFLQAILFNRMLNNFNIFGKTTFLPALMYVVCASVFMPFLVLSQPLICNFLLLFVLYKILSAYKNPDEVATMFDLGLVIAIGTLLYFPFILFMLLIWIALILFRPFNWREWLSPLLGYFTIVFMLGVFYYWNGRLSDFYEIWKPLSNAIPFYLKIKISDYVVLLPLFLVVILGVFHISQNFFRSAVLVRKSLQFQFFFFLVASLSFYLKSDFRINHFLLSIIPISICLTYYFISAKKRWVAESLFFLIISFIIYFQFV